MKKSDLCFQCGKKGHFSKFCPDVKKAKPLVPKVANGNNEIKNKKIIKVDKDIKVNGSTTTTESTKKVSILKNKVSQNSKTLIEVVKDIKVNRTTNTAESTNKVPNSKKKVSQNWKKLIESGAVKLNRSKISTQPNGELANKKNTSENGQTKRLKAVAIDCEMVGVGEGGKDSNIARVSLVDEEYNVLYDKYVKPIEKVSDYRTHVSGIRPQDLVNAYEFKDVQNEVNNIIEGKILVGHAIRNDLRGLFLCPPQSRIRDTSKYKPFRKLFDGRTPSLKNLALQLIDTKIQTGEHSSVEDAKATMGVYNTVRVQWEKELNSKRNNKHSKKNKH